MNIYIGYKYKNNKNKEGLQTNLEKISNKLQEACHSCFVLGRDIHSWNITHISTSKSLIPIIKNIKKTDILFAFIDHPGESLGLRFETLSAKILGKKIVLAVKKDLPEKFFRSMATEVIEFDDAEDLLQKIPATF